jgi:hypothetical protein
MKNIILLLLLMLTVTVPSLFAQSVPADSALAVIEAAYSGGQYLSAELEARRLLETSGVSDSAAVQAEKWIAFALIAQGKTASARDRFISMLQKDESFQLDQLLTSPKILAVFNDARSRVILQRKVIAADTTAVQQVNSRSMPPPVSFRTIVFPGWEQIHQGREGTGYAFLGAGAAALSAGLLFEFLRADAHDQYLSARTPQEISDTYDTYNTYRKAEIYSFAAFAAVYILSEIDVFRHQDLQLTAGTSPRGAKELTLSVRF